MLKHVFELKEQPSMSFKRAEVQTRSSASGLVPGCSAAAAAEPALGAQRDGMSCVRTPAAAPLSWVSGNSHTTPQNLHERPRHRVPSNPSAFLCSMASTNGKRKEAV